MYQIFPQAFGFIYEQYFKTIYNEKKNLLKVYEEVTTLSSV